MEVYFEFKMKMSGGIEIWLSRNSMEFYGIPPVHGIPREVVWGCKVLQSSMVTILCILLRYFQDTVSNSIEPCTLCGSPGVVGLLLR